MGRSVDDNNSDFIVTLGTANLFQLKSLSLKKLMFCIVGLCSLNKILAQELSVTPNIMNNLGFFNPAFVAKDHWISATAQHNTFINGSPSLYNQNLLAYEQFFESINSGISIQASMASYGPFRRSSLLLAYSYMLPLKKEKSALRFGVSGGLRTLQSDLFPVGPDAYINKPNRFTINGGIAYTSQHFNIGYSFMQMNGKHRWTEFSYPFTSVHTLYADYTFKVLRGKNTTLKSGIITNYDGFGMDIYWANRVDFNKKWYALSSFSRGRNYTFGYGIGIGVTFLECLTMGYAYENRKLSNLNNTQHSHNHEFVLGYRLQSRPKKQIRTTGTPSF